MSFGPIGFKVSKLTALRDRGLQDLFFWGEVEGGKGPRVMGSEVERGLA